MQKPCHSFPVSLTSRNALKVFGSTSGIWISLLPSLHLSLNIVSNTGDLAWRKIWWHWILSSDGPTTNVTSQCFSSRRRRRWDSVAAGGAVSFPKSTFGFDEPETWNVFSFAKGATNCKQNQARLYINRTFSGERMCQRIIITVAIPNLCPEGNMNIIRNDNDFKHLRI